MRFGHDHVAQLGGELSVLFNRVNVTPGQIFSSLSLEKVAEALLVDVPNASTLESGWRAGESGDEHIGLPRVTPPAKPLTVREASGHLPRRVHLRFFEYVKNSFVTKYAASGTSPDVTFLQGTDLIICESDSASRFTILISSDAGTHLNKVVRSVSDLLAIADRGSAVTALNSPINFDQPDLYLWLLTRARDKRRIDAGMKVNRVDALSGRDKSSRVTAMTKGVSFDRPAFLVAIADAERLGPAQLRISDTDVNGYLVFTLSTNGSFRLSKSFSHYREPDDEVEVGMRYALDLVFSVIPRIIAAYQGDEVWKTTQRAAEIVSAARALIARYQERFPEMTAPEGDSLADTGDSDTVA